jgi:predicted Zn-dependent protease
MLIAMLARRLVPITLIMALLSATCPSPALAMSTQSEIEMGRAYDQQIVEQNVVLNDPLLNQWVQSIAAKLWTETARKDVPYNIKILKDNSVNAFSTLGGYVYVNSGILDFVQSDDELAGVIGHETGHIERRHVVTMQAKSTILSLLLGIASLFSPFIYNFGNLLQAGAIAKMSRLDELQADRYGLLLMARAGYDPRAMETMLAHMGALGEHNDLVSKYFQDHPGVPNRIAHVLGYPELDPTKTTAQQRLVWALHDEDEARYNVAAIELGDILKTDPGNQEALLALGRSQLALGLTSRSEQTLGQLTQSTSPQVKAAALERITALREMEDQRVDLTRPDLTAIQDQLKTADAVQEQAQAQIGARHDEGHSQLKSLENRLEVIGSEPPAWLQQLQPRHGSRLEALERNLNGMTRSINSAFQDATSAIDDVGSIDQKTGKPYGLLKENADILSEMEAPLRTQPIPPESVAIFSSYPQMLAELTGADGDMERAVDAGRAASMQLDSGLADLDMLFRRMNQIEPNYFGDIGEMDFASLAPLIQKAETSLGQAATSASQAAQLYDLARSRQLAARITLLGLGNSAERYDTLKNAINVRWNVDDLSYSDMLHDDLTPGDLTAASIIAADLKTTPTAIVREAHEAHESVFDVASSHGMNTLALEIFMGLIYLDYTDDPNKEAHPAPLVNGNQGSV